jgi:uncharacterized protein
MRCSGLLRLRQETAMTKILIVPGLFGSDEGHWQHFWLDDVPQSRLVGQDDWNHARLDRWMERLERALLEAGEAYIIAHSLGCILTARLADRPVARRIKGALLVAPCDLPATERLHPGSLAFGPMPTTPLPFPSLTVGSLDDKYMSLDRLSFYTRLWKTEVRNIGLAGHINIASGFGRWTGGYALFDVVKGKAKAKRPQISPHATTAASA